MAERQSSSYGLRRAAPKKTSQDFTYFNTRREGSEQDLKRPRTSDETHIEILSSPEAKKGRGRPRKVDPSLDPREERFRASGGNRVMISTEETEAASCTLEEVVEHTEEVIPFEPQTDFVFSEDGDTIQIIGLAQALDGDDEARDFDESGGDLGKDRIECPECHKMLKPASYRQHLKTHVALKPHSCELCSAKFTRRGDVERHVRIVHKKDKPFQCNKCNRAFGDKKNLRWHLMNHDKKIFHVCETCGFKFGKKDYYDNHVKFIHPQAEAEEDDVEAEVEVGFNQSEALERSPKSSKSALNMIDLSNMQLHTILDQSQGRRIAVIGSDGEVKYLTVTSKNQNKPGPQVVSLKALERMNTVSRQQIANLHQQHQVDMDKLKAVVIEVAESEDIIEEIVVPSDVDDEQAGSVEDGANVTMIEALLDAAGASSESKELQLLTLDIMNTPGQP